MPRIPIAPGSGLREPHGARHRFFPTCRREQRLCPSLLRVFQAALPATGTGEDFAAPGAPGGAGSGRGGRGWWRCRGGGTARAGGTGGRKLLGGRSCGRELISPQPPGSGRCRQKTLPQVLPLCRDPALPIPGWGDGEAASLRGEEAAQRLPGVPDVLHRLVPTAQGLYPSRMDTGVGKGPDAAALEGSGEGRSRKTRGSDTVPDGRWCQAAAPWLLGGRARAGAWRDGK